MHYSRATLAALAFVLVCVDAGILRRPNMHNDSPEAAEKKPPKPAGDLASFFAKNDMSQYSDAFFKNGFENVQDIIDAELTETDFKELGVQKMRDRKTLLNVIASGESAAPTLPTPNPSPRKQAPESDDDQKLRKTERKKQARELVDAVLAGDIPLVKALLEAGVKVDAKTKVNRGMKWTPLRWAALGNTTEQGYRKTEFDNMQGLTVVNQNATDMLQVLVDAGADTNYIDEAGQCALHTASFIGRADIIKFLLDNGAQPDIIGKDGLSPMHWAANKNQPESVTALATGGATVDVQDGRYSSSPLFMAADRQHVAAAEALLLAGADPNLGLPEDIVEAKIHVVKGVRVPLHHLSIYMYICRSALGTAAERG
jgi:ankyrin repeat protein